jgi:AraC-like DNA-binding protein
MSFVIAPLFSAACSLTGGQGMVARDLESLDRNMRFTFPHLQEVIPLSREPLWHRSTGWMTGSAGFGIGQHTAIRIKTAGIYGLALYVPLGGMATVRQDDQTFTPQSQRAWMLFNEQPALAETIATSGITIGLQRDRLQSTYDTMCATQGNPIATHSQALSLETLAGRQAERALPLLLHCTADASRRWPAAMPLAEDMVYRFVARMLINDSTLPRSALHKLNEKRNVELSCAFMFSAFDQAISLTDVERASGMGARALQLAFARCLGQAPMSWLKEQRLQRARQLFLRHPDMPVSHVALACGLSHFGRFAADFKARFGVNPSELSKTPAQLH